MASVKSQGSGGAGSRAGTTAEQTCARVTQSTNRGPLVTRAGRHGTRLGHCVGPMSALASPL